MDRRTFVRTAAGAVLVKTFPADAHSSTNAPRIGYMTDSSRPQSDVEALQHALRELGYVEGHNVAFAWRFADTPEKYAPLAAELVALKVDVIVVRTGYMALAAQSATRNIAIVMVTSGDA